jgi:putative ABC transport system substrate-binding protein
MRRRDFAALLGAAAILRPRAALAQAPLIPVVGVLASNSAPDFEPFVPAFRAGLEQHGFVEGRNVKIEYRWADGHYDRLPGLAAELARLPVAVLVATGVTAASPPRPPPPRLRSSFTRAATPSGSVSFQVSPGPAAT